MPGSSLKLARLRRREEGITAVEYALMVAVVAVLLVVGFYFLFSNIQDKFSNTGNCVADAPSAAGCSPAAPPAP